MAPNTSTLSSSLLLVVALGAVCVASRNTPALAGLSAQRHEDFAELSAPFAARPRAAAPKPLECFQVTQPVLGPTGPVYSSVDNNGNGIPASDASCSVLLMDHSFGWSYELPFIANYTPPDCEFNRVILNFTVTSAGRQFDRLALMYLGDTEVWRTSTAEPRATPGIAWTYWKDMTEYLALWKSPQNLIFDLGNLIDDKYTGAFNTTLTATFFQSDVPTDNAPPADLIIPISARRGAVNAISAWSLPEQEAINKISFPQNVHRAVFSVSANGQSAAEEFWWANLLQSDVAAFNSTVGEYAGYSPFREVQVLIDGQLAGVQWPFPVIFTGGISPSFHRPIVGIDAFDLREHEIDITPWLPILCDGKEHSFKIQVAGINDDGDKASLTNTVGLYWVVTGKIFVWLDEEGSITTGKPPTILAPDPVILFSHEGTQDADGVNETLKYTLDVKRVFSVTGEVISQKGAQKPKWSQDLAYSQLGSVASFGLDQINNMTITGTDESSGPVFYQTSYSYPLYVKSTYDISPTNNLTIQAQLYQGLDLEVRGAAVFPTGLEAFNPLESTQGVTYAASKLSTFRDGTAAFFQTGDGKSSSGYGTTHQYFHFGGISKEGIAGGNPAVELYFRNVTAANDSVVFDQEVLAGMQQRILSISRPPQLESIDRQFAATAGRASGLRAFTDGSTVAEREITNGHSFISA